MNIVHVLTNIHEPSSGMTYSVSALCRELAARGHEITLHSLGRPAREPLGYMVNSYPTAQPGASYGRSPVLKRELAQAAKSADIVHSHGLWRMPNVYPEQATRHTDASLVVSPRGTLEAGALAFSRMRKTLAWRLVQGKAVERADLLHATAEGEAKSLRDRGLTNPIAVVPNGVDIPLRKAEMAEGRRRRRVLALGRIHPKKGLDILIQAFLRVNARYPDWELWIVGPDDDARYARHLRELAGNQDCVIFPGPAYGHDRSEAYLQADLFVLPSHSENFGMVVAEALAHGVPAIVTKGAPWPGLRQKDCGWWVERESAVFTAALDEAMSQSIERHREMGQRGREWMRSEFSWAAVAARMEAAYRWLDSNDRRPRFTSLESGQRAPNKWLFGAKDA